MKTLLRTASGSFVYGCNVPSSDHDYKALFIPSSRDIILGTTNDAFNETTKINQNAKNSSDDVETEFFSLKKYIGLLMQGQTVALDILFTPKEFHLESSPIWDEIVANKDKFLHSGMTSFVGYCRQQSAKYSLKGNRVTASREAMNLLQRLIDEHHHLHKVNQHWDEVEKFVNSGVEHVSIVTETMKANGQTVRMLEVCNRKIQEHVTLKEAHKIFKMVFDEYGERARAAEANSNADLKALYHAVRISEQAIELLKTGHITFPRPEKDLLLKIRRAEVPYKDISELVENNLQIIESIKDKSVLPSKPDYEYANDFVYDAYKSHLLSRFDGSH